MSAQESEKSTLGTKGSRFAARFGEKLKPAPRQRDNVSDHLGNVLPEQAGVVPEGIPGAAGMVEGIPQQRIVPIPAPGSTPRIEENLRIDNLGHPPAPQAEVPSITGAGAGETGNDRVDGSEKQTPIVKGIHTRTENFNLDVHLPKPARFEDTHQRRTYWYSTDVLQALDLLAKKGGRGYVTKFIDQALREALSKKKR